MPKAKPTTIYMDDEDRELAAKRKQEYGQRSFTGLVRLWLRIPPKKR
jgi:hypothetical protein